MKVDEFRSLVRAQAYSTLHDGTSKPFKAKVTAEELKEYIIPFHSEITGEPRTLIHWKTALNPNVGHLLFLYYNTGKEQQGLNEEFIFVTEENEFRLLNYRRW